MKAPKKKIFFIIGFLVVAAVVAFFLIRRKKANAAATNPGNTTPATNTDTGTLPTKPPITPETQQSVKSWPIKKGDKGIEVMFIQAWLVIFQDKNIAIDGIYGSQTAAAWKSINGTDEVCSTCYTIAIMPVETVIRAYLTQNKYI